MKTRQILTLAFLGTASSLSAATTFFNVSDLSTWSSSSQVQYFNDVTDTIDLGGKTYTVGPAPSHDMVLIVSEGYGSTDVEGAAAAEAKFGLSAGSISDIWGDNTTDYGYITKTLHFTAGTYEFSWSYGAKDYQPYNDGALFSLVGNGSQIIKYLAVNGTDGGTGYQPPAGDPFSSTVSLGSYGSTVWRTTTFTVGTEGDYQFSLATYNWQDTDLSSNLFVSIIPGIIIGDTVNIGGFGAIPEPSTYGLILGSLAFAVCAVRRRTRKCKA